MSRRIGEPFGRGGRRAVTLIGSVLVAILLGGLAGGLAYLLLEAIRG